MSALETLYSPDSTAEYRRAADSWLQNFVHSVDCWEVAGMLLQDPQRPSEVKVSGG